MAVKADEIDEVYKKQISESETGFQQTNKTEEIRREIEGMIEHARAAS